MCAGSQTILTNFINPNGNYHAAIPLDINQVRNISEVPSYEIASLNNQKKRLLRLPRLLCMRGGQKLTDKKEDTIRNLIPDLTNKVEVGQIMEIDLTTCNKKPHKNQTHELFSSLFISDPDMENTFSAKIIETLKIITNDLLEVQIFKLFEYLLHKISSATHHQKSIQSNYWWTTFFYSLNHVPSNFYNDNIDLTALVLLKCYEFLSLRSDGDNALKHLQGELEKIVYELIAKIEEKNKEVLVKEILSGQLPCSSLHQYDSVSLDHYILKQTMK